MASGPNTAPANPTEPPQAGSPRFSARRSIALIVIAGILALIGALAAGYYFAVRPVTLRIAVGPANSDDLKVVQALSQAFADIPQPDPLAADPDRRRHHQRANDRGRQGRPRHRSRRSERAEKCASGGDGAQERRGAVGAGPAEGQEAGFENHQDFAVGRTPYRRRRPHAGQCRSAQGDPATIRRGPEQGRGRPVPDQRCG